MPVPGTSSYPIYCSQIVRTPEGSLAGVTVAGGGYFLQKDFNLGLTIVSGFDLQMVLVQGVAGSAIVPTLQVETMQPFSWTW
jgi:hypothetical protein